jgi:dihydroneopterin aldolase
MDTLTLHELEIWTHIGVPKEERRHIQRLCVSVEIRLDTKKAGKEDNINRTIDYVPVVDAIKMLAQKERKTIECFAEDTGDMIMKSFHPESVTVTVAKFSLKEASYLSLTIHRP